MAEGKGEWLSRARITLSEPSLEIVVFRVTLKNNFGLSHPERQNKKVYVTLNSRSRVRNEVESRFMRLRRFRVYPFDFSHAELVSASQIEHISLIRNL